MIGEYAIIGPACFVMETMPELAVPVRYGAVRSLRGNLVEPPEVWIDLHKTWVRLDGQWVSGWRDDGTHFGFRPRWLNRWKIRRAAKTWRRALPSHKGAE